MLDADAIRAALSDAVALRIAVLEVFAEIASTNSYLIQRPGPSPGELSVAATTNQTAGRGRRGRRWVSPPGAGLCLSVACTFDEPPENLSALTLAAGVGVIAALEDAGAPGIRLKWPNDLILAGGKLGGILAEARTQPGEPCTIVIGVGVNLDLGPGLELGEEAAHALPPVDLRAELRRPPGATVLAASLITGLDRAIENFRAAGFAAFAAEWAALDWLSDRPLVVDAPPERIRGRGAGIADDGALLVDTGSGGLRRVTSGTIEATRSR